MKILAIETSCDDTGIAILEVSKGPKGYPNFNVLSNIIASQIEIHKQYGGVYPMMAKREHQKNILPTFIKALKESALLKPTQSAFFTSVKNTDIEKIMEREPALLKKIIPFLKKYAKPDIDFISVTHGPGLEPCLWVGINFAKCLSYFWNIPIVAVNHIESHILVNLLENPPSHKASARQVRYPAIALIVSGGHTQIILVEKIGKYKILGETRDDAAGECFDKCAKILGLDYPGGPIISKLAEGIKNPSTSSGQALPRPMIGTKDYDFSFSGLKTAVLYSWQKQNKKNQTTQAIMAAEVQQAIIDVLIKKTIKAIKDFNAKSLILGGGVSANKELRKQFKDKIEKENLNIDFFVPTPNLSTDNGVMTAIAGYFKAKQKKIADWHAIKANANLRI